MDELRTSSLPPPPQVTVEVVDDHSATSRCDDGFVRVRRLSLRNRYPDGSESEAYRYDVTERRATDAVAVVLYQRQPTLRICLRAALRPPVALRTDCVLPLPHDGVTMLWELPAGLIEPEEQGEAGIRRCAARETLEETGYDLAESAFHLLGPPAYLSPGLAAEKMYFFAACVDGAPRGEQVSDGSAVEAHAPLHLVPLSRLIAFYDGADDDARTLPVEDVKTEVGVRRLQAWLRKRGELA